MTEGWTASRMSPVIITPIIDSKIDGHRTDLLEAPFEGVSKIMTEFSSTLESAGLPFCVSR
jgi:hypothetical protein